MIFPAKLHKITILTTNEEKTEVIRQLHKLAAVHITQSPTETEGLQADTSLPGTNQIGEALLQLRYIAEQTNTSTEATTINKLPTPLLALTEAKAFINKYLPQVQQLQKEEKTLTQKLQRVQARKEILETIPFEITKQPTLIFEANKEIKITIKKGIVHQHKHGNKHYTKIEVQEEHVQAVREALQETELKEINTTFITKNTKETKQELQRREEELETNITNNNKQQTTLLGVHTSTLQHLLISLENHYEAYTLPNKFSRTQELTLITGYCEKKDFKKLKKAIPQATITAQKADKQAPTKLANNKFTTYFEPLTKLFSTPKYTSIDPTFIVSIFFPIFFGLMLADIGYALILLALIPIIKNYTHEKWPRRILTLSAISTMLFGAIFGSFFGGLIPLQPIYTSSFEATIPLLILSITLGLIHMNLGVLLGLIQAIKNQEKQTWSKAAPFWLLQLAIAAYFTQNTTAGHIILAATAALLIRNQGVFGIMNLTSYIGQVFSYARILALSLATAGVALAVNTIAEQTLSLGTLGIALWLIIILAGHAFNFVVSIIGVSINAARLHYVEFFSLFFEGGGELFNPFMRKNYTEVQQ
ncbi:MAG: V-type ATP synthase subunit I [Candidatus Woesearchaeota archaeon]